MRTENPPIAAATIIPVSHRSRILLRIRQRPKSRNERAVPDLPPPPQRRPFPVPDRVPGHGMQPRKHGPCSPAVAMRNAPAMCQHSADRPPENPHAPTAFPEALPGHRIAADPPQPVRPPRRHRTPSAARAVTGSIVLDAGISSRITAPGPIVPAVRLRASRREIRNVRHRTRRVVSRHRRPHRLSHPPAPAPVTGSGNPIAASGFE